MSHTDDFAKFQQRQEAQRQERLGRMRTKARASERRRIAEDKAPRTPAQVVQLLRKHASDKVISVHLARSMCAAYGLEPRKVIGVAIRWEGKGVPPALVGRGLCRELDIPFILDTEMLRPKDMPEAACAEAANCLEEFNYRRAGVLSWRKEESSEDKGTKHPRH